MYAYTDCGLEGIATDPRSGLVSGLRVSDSTPPVHAQAGGWICGRAGGRTILECAEPQTGTGTQAGHTSRHAGADTQMQARIVGHIDLHERKHALEALYAAMFGVARPDTCINGIVCVPHAAAPVCTHYKARQILIPGVRLRGGDTCILRASMRASKFSC